MDNAKKQFSHFITIFEKIFKDYHIIIFEKIETRKNIIINELKEKIEEEENEIRLQNAKNEEERKKWLEKKEKI